MNRYRYILRVLRHFVVDQAHSWKCLGSYKRVDLIWVVLSTSAYIYRLMKLFNFQISQSTSINTLCEYSPPPGILHETIGYITHETSHSPRVRGDRAPNDPSGVTGTRQSDGNHCSCKSHLCSSTASLIIKVIFIIKQAHQPTRTVFVINR